MAKGPSSVAICNIAGMVQMALQTATTFSKMRVVFDDAMSSDNLTMPSLVAGDIDSFDALAVVDIMLRAIDLLGTRHLPWNVFK